MGGQEGTPSKCAICGRGLEAYLHNVRDSLTGETFSIHRCGQCGLGHTVPLPPDLERYYRGNYYGDRHGFTSRHCVKRRLRYITAAGFNRNGGKLLDIGCGDGSFLLAVRQAGWVGSGTELNPVPARDLGFDVEESLAGFPAAASFDCITMWHTLEHMPDLPTVMYHVVRLLKPGGKLLIAVPDFGGLQARVFRSKWLHADVPRHLYHFDAQAMSRCLEIVGFSVERMWHQELEYDLLGWSQSALNLVMSQPNVFFETLRGRGAGYRRLTRFGACLAGLVLTCLSFPALALGTLSGRGGTLVVVATRRDSHEGKTGVGNGS